nr:AAA family ATPase [Mycoplasmopsis agalactiae]
MTFFTFHSNKGGVGKTTITLNIADALAKQNKKVSKKFNIYNLDNKQIFELCFKSNYRVYNNEKY